MVVAGRGFPMMSMIHQPVPRIPVAYDATGAGYTIATTASSVNASESHTAVATTVIAAVAVLSNKSGHVSSFTRTAKYGSNNMTSLGVMDCNNSTYGWVELFGIKGAPSGAQTVTATVTGGSPSFLAAAVNTVSYANVGAFGAAVTNFGASTSPSSGPVTCAPKQLVVQAFATVNVGTVGTQGGYTGTSRWAQNLTNGSNALHITLGDSSGTSSVTFEETLTAADYWASVAVPLLSI